MLSILFFLCSFFADFSGIFGIVVPMNDSSRGELMIAFPFLDSSEFNGESSFQFLFTLGLFKAAAAYSLEKCNDRLEPRGLHVTPIFVHGHLEPVNHLKDESVTSLPWIQVGLHRELLDLIREYRGICTDTLNPLQEKNAHLIAFLSNTIGDMLYASTGISRQEDIESVVEYFCTPLINTMYLESDHQNSFTNQVLLQMMQELQGTTAWFYETADPINPFDPPLDNSIVLCTTNCTARPCIVLIDPNSQYSATPQPAAVYILPNQGIVGWESLHGISWLIGRKQLNRRTPPVVIMSHGAIDNPWLFTYSNRTNWDIEMSNPDEEDNILKTFEVLAIQATIPDNSVPRYLKNLRYGDLIGKDHLKELKQFMEFKCNEAKGPWSNYTSCPLDYTFPEAYNTHFFDGEGIVHSLTNGICSSLENLMAEKCGREANRVCDKFWEGFIKDEEESSDYESLLETETNSIGSGIYYNIYHLNTSSYTWRVVGQVNVTKPGYKPQFKITWFDEDLKAQLRRFIDTNPFYCQDNQHQTCKNHERKVSNQTCCFTCIPCDPFSYPDSKKFFQDCKDCSVGYVSSRNASGCVWSVTPMIDWTKASDFGVTSFIIIVLLLSLTCLALSIYKCSSPILKMSLPVHFFGTISLAILSCICGLIIVRGFASESGSLGGYCIFLWFFVCVTIVANGIFLLTKLQTYGPLVDFCIGGTMQQLMRRKLITASVLAIIQAVIMSGTAASFHGTALIVLNKRIDSRPPSWGNDCLWVTELRNGEFLPSLLFPLVLQFCVVVRAGLFVRYHVSVKFINREILVILVCAVVQLIVGIAVLVLLYSDASTLNNLSQGEGKMLILLIYSVLNAAISVLVLVVPQLAMMMCGCGFLIPNPAAGHVTSDLLMNRVRS